MINYKSAYLSLYNLGDTGQRRGIAQSKKKQLKHRTGALRNKRTARVCSRRSKCCQSRTMGRASYRWGPLEGQSGDGQVKVFEVVVPISLLRFPFCHYRFSIYGDASVKHRTGGGGGSETLSLYLICCGA